MRLSHVTNVMQTLHNEHPQSLRQKMGRRVPECLAFRRETEQKPAHWHTKSCSTAIHANFLVWRM